MHPTIRGAIDWTRRCAEKIIAGLLGTMFVAFLVQIELRYIFNFPIGWTSELSVITWLYMVLLGAAFWLKEGEEISFDLVAGSMGRRARRIIGTLIAAATVVLFAMSLPATIKYVAFMKVEKSSYLGIRMDYLYSIYLVFAVAVIARSLRQLVRGPGPAAADASTPSSAL